MPRLRVVIVGAGFGGLQCARPLRRSQLDVLLVDANNYHLFTPLLYQVASSLLNPSDIAYPVRAIFRRSPVRFLHDRIVGADFAQQTVRTASGDDLRYDYLVLAAGSTTNFFGLESVAGAAHGLKDLPEALELRNHVLRCFERASASADAPERARLLTFVIVGGGPTGVEYAGALSELVKLVLPAEYPELASQQARIVVVEARPRPLAAFPERLGANALGQLRRRGIEVMTGARVVHAEPGRVALEGGAVLRAETLVWAAGVKPAELTAALDAPRSRSGRLEVDQFLRLRGQPRVFAIGDLASAMHQGKEVPMLSAPAMQQGRRAAANILADAAGRPLRPFRYRDRGSMATIGRNAAVAALGPLRLTGFLGWVAWLVVHLYFLIGFRNRLVVLLGWAWNYLRLDRPVRIIARARPSPGDDAGPQAR